MRVVGVMLVVLGGCSHYAYTPSCSDRDPCPAGEYCDTSRPVSLCEPLELDAAPADAPAVGGCPASYMPLGFSHTRYLLHTMPKTWTIAAADCADDLPAGGQLHTHLAVLGEDLERSSLNALASPMSAWIGLTDRKMNGDYRWVTAEDTMGYPAVSGSPWAAGQPSNDTGADCIIMNQVADLDDQSCEAGFAYFCECDAYANEPARY